MKNKLLISGCFCLTLAGCIGHDTGTADLQSFVADEKSKEARQIDEIPPIETIPQFPYVSQERRDPFDTGSSETSGGSSGDVPEGLSVIPPEIKNHPPEELENFPLDSLSMQGTLKMKGLSWVLIQDPEGTLHRVKAGNYLGKNYGRITSISEERIVLTEYYRGLNGYEPRQAEIVLENL